MPRSPGASSLVILSPKPHSLALLLAFLRLQFLRLYFTHIQAASRLATFDNRHAVQLGGTPDKRAFTWAEHVRDQKWTIVFGRSP
ncbi:hypothetical protein OBBRIDRAFT_791648, partial [Obba rivulosa]